MHEKAYMVKTDAFPMFKHVTEHLEFVPQNLSTEEMMNVIRRKGGEYTHK